MVNLCIWKKSCIYKHGHKPCPKDCADFINKTKIQEELGRIEHSTKEITHEKKM